MEAELQLTCGGKPEGRYYLAVVWDWPRDWQPVAPRQYCVGRAIPMLERPELWTRYMQFDCGLATCSSIVDSLHAVRFCGLAVCSSIEGSGGLSSLDASRAASSTLGTVDVSVCLDALSGDLCLIVVCVTRASELPGFSFRLSLPHL